MSNKTIGKANVTTSAIAQSDAATSINATASATKQSVAVNAKTSSIAKAIATTLNDLVAAQDNVATNGNVTTAINATAYNDNIVTTGSNRADVKAQRASTSPRKIKAKASHRKTPINATSHVYIRRGYLYLYARLNGKTYRHTTGKEATGENIEWAKNNWERVIRRAIRKKEAKAAAKRKAEREAAKALSRNLAQSAITTLSNDPLCIATYGAQAIKNGAYLRKQGTNNKYDYVFTKRIIPVFGGMSVDEVKPSHVREWQSNLANEGLKTSTIKQYRSILNASFTAAIDDEIVDRNPVSMVKAPKTSTQREKTFYSGRSKPSVMLCQRRLV